MLLSRRAIGAWLYKKLFKASDKLRKILNPGETWILGDSPLVVLTALSDWTYYNHTGSSAFDEPIAPHLNSDGSFEQRGEGRKIRVYKSIDTRMMFSDFFCEAALKFRNVSLRRAIQSRARVGLASAMLSEGDLRAPARPEHRSLRL